MPEHDLIDATVSNQIALRRYLAREIREMQKLFEDYDRLTAQLLRRKYHESLVIGGEDLKKLYAEIKALRTELMGKANRRARNMARELGSAESEKEWAMLLLLLLRGQRSKPKSPALKEVLGTPFASGNRSAATFKEWFHRMRAVDLVNVRDALARSVTESATTSKVVDLVLGTKGKKFADGILARTRHNMAALLATLGTHVSDFVRRHIWERTPEVIGATWSSILDRKTTIICVSRANKVVMFGNNPVPKGAKLLRPQAARPPAHVRCRSMMAPLRAGKLPSRRTPADWLANQPVGVQEDILGKAKSEMFRKGKISIDQLVDSSGKEFTLQQLQTAT